MKKFLILLIFICFLTSCQEKSKNTSTGRVRIAMTEVSSGGAIDQYIILPYAGTAEWLEFRTVYDSSPMPGPSDPTLYVIISTEKSLPVKKSAPIQFNEIALRKMRAAEPELDVLLKEGREVEGDPVLIPGVISYYAIQKANKVFLVIGKM